MKIASLFKSFCLSGFLLLLVGCQLPVSISNSNANINDDGTSIGTTSSGFAENDYQGIPDASFSLSEGNNEPVLLVEDIEPDEITGGVELVEVMEDEVTTDVVFVDNNRANQVVEEVDVVLPILLPVVPAIPVAKVDEFDVKQSQMALLDILKNDDGIDGGTQVSLVSQAESGFVTVQDDGSLAYTPNDSYVGQDSFVYKITNQEGVSSLASVQLNIKCMNNCTSEFMISWEASQSVNVVGYNIYMGRAEGELDSVFEIGNEVQFAYIAEQKGEYYFAVSAVNDNGEESELTETVFGVF